MATAKPTARNTPAKPKQSSSPNLKLKPQAQPQARARARAVFFCFGLVGVFLAVAFAVAIPHQLLFQTNLPSKMFQNSGMP